MRKIRIAYIVTISTLIVALVSGVPLTRDASADTASEAKRAREAASVMTEIMGAPDSGIPEELMERAKAIAVIPNVVKAAFGIGGRHGKGLVSQRLSNGEWSAPSYIEISGGSFGPQIGVESTDLVLVFTNEDGVRPLLNGKVTLGADASVAAGPVGRKASVGTDVTLKTGIFTYSRSKGLFAGLSLDGAAVTISDGANRDVYGGGVTAREILTSGKVPVNATVRPFVEALQRYSPGYSPTRKVS